MTKEVSAKMIKHGAMQEKMLTILVRGTAIT